MKTQDLPDAIVSKINALLRVHELMTDDSKTSAIGFIPTGKSRGWYLGGTYPIEFTEVLARLKSAGANVKPVTDALTKHESDQRKAIAKRDELRTSALKKLTKEEAEACGLV